MPMRRAAYGSASPSHYYLFRGTPTRMWLDFAFEELFGLEERLCASNAGAYYDTISAKLASPAFRPRALYDQFNIEVLATTNPPLDPLNLPSGDPRLRMEGPHLAYVSPRFGRRSRIRWLPPECAAAGRDARRGLLALARLSARSAPRP